MKIRLVTLLLLSCTLSFGQSFSKMKESALSLYSKGKYRQALELLQMCQRQKGDDIEILSALGVSAYHSYNIPLAKQFLNIVSENKKVEPIVFLYLGKTYHAELNFKEAVKNYKQFLQRAKEDDPNRRAVIADIKRCGSGLRIIQQPELALVENLGENVNSMHDEFAPLQSPNFDEKIYFSAAREDSEGGLRNDDGFADFKNGHYNSDIYFTTFEGSDWAFPTHLENLLINTPRNEVMLDFTRNGRVMLFLRGINQFTGTVMVDTFKSESETRSLPPQFLGPLNEIDGDNSLFVFNDTLVLFSSRRKGGLGGSDLYYTVLRDGTWTEPTNFGSPINSPFDETTPYLAKDGRTLYFSSNSTASIGGFDVFKATFNEDSLRFNIPVNLGKPINSAGDDTYFRLTADGLRSYFCSNRREGYGERDIYTGIFKAFQKEQTPSTPAVFYQVESFKNSVASTDSDNNNINNAKVEEIQVSSLFYETDDDLLKGENLQQLRNLVNILKRYPNLKVILTINGNPGEKHSFDLYFGMKRAEILAKYMSSNGIANNSILIKSVGALYPIALTSLDGAPNPAGEKMNRRVDIQIRNITTEPLKVNYKVPPVSQFMIDKQGEEWAKHAHGLSYKVLIINTKRIYDNNIINTAKDAYVEASGTEGVYSYSVGLFSEYAGAERLRRELYKEGFKEAIVVPYVDGVRLFGEEAKRLSTRYSDLNNYLASKKKP